MATVLPSACPLDCPDACTLAVTVEDDRVLKVDGDERNPFTAGTICKKTRRFGERVDHALRILHPLVRRGPKGSADFAPISWDEALAMLCDRITKVRDTDGAGAILPYCYGGSNGYYTQASADARLWSRLGACH